VTVPPTCPRCGGQVRAPGLMSSDWRCAEHGAVLPLHISAHVGIEAIERVRQQAVVPVWAPWPMLQGWTVTGVAHAGDERSRGRAVAVACAGPAPLGGVADMVLVAEEPGVGLGAYLAGLAGPDPGRDFACAPHAKVVAAGHPTPLWTVPSEADRCVFVGEARAQWLWAVMWPADAGYVLAEHVVLVDLRDVLPAELVFGAPSPYLHA
jgi:hypothetical protein